MGLEADFYENFSDVSKEKYYYEAVGIAKKLNIISGVGDNKFNPETPIKRQDLMVIVHNALKTAGLTIEDSNTSELEKFKGASDISDYAIESIASLVKEEIITGNANKELSPLKNITRAETAAIIYKIH
ncbi:S-layer homology domain-containing protein [Herbivorax sp. ANBcel31]|uniref:S-layer homology domain-containing protein n=1 Tax=Herbivorax sp. ANBcel31 TaxID=3069754 RepID=UPI0027B6F97D|nr:S-layer homology domain-containing protein [Herbivorax sp. ANBcel31]MDQ2087623.1 S-layer homology domain-containing protein [Herbivorax sp. ANBcel31]